MQWLNRSKNLIILLLLLYLLLLFDYLLTLINPSEYREKKD